MDTSNIPIGIIAAANADPEIINRAIRNRAETLAGEMRPEAAAQFVADMGELQCVIEGEAQGLTFSLTPSQSYLLNYLKSHGTPVTGGDGGTVHDVDGSTYPSKVPPQLWGVPLPWLELPTVQGEDEAQHILEIMAPDCANDAVQKSSAEIAELIKPIVTQEISQRLGGGKS